VEFRIPLGGTGSRRQRVQLVAVLPQVGGQGLQQRGPLVEGQLPQRRTAHATAVVQGGGAVDALRGDARDLVTGHGVAQRRALVLGGAPATAYVASQQRCRALHHASLELPTERSGS